MSQHHTLTAFAVASLFAAPAFAADSEAPLVIVTASRFAASDAAVPANISLITRQDILANPGLNLPDLLKARAGVALKSYGGALASSTVVDLRGFGATGDQNTLILLDGQRLNSIDSAAVNWSLIPLDSVERIEIIRGSGSVLYGDRASGGVINIITDKSGKPAAAASATVGSYGYQGVDAQLAGSEGGKYAKLFVHSANSAGWRTNSQADELSLSGRAGHQFGNGEAFVDFSANRDSAGLAGALFTNQYLGQPTMTRKPLDTQSRSGYRIRPGVAFELAPGLAFEGEIAFKQEHNHSISGTTYTLDSVGDTWSATPRLRWSHGLAGMKSETVAGVDYYAGRIAADSLSAYAGANTQRASQKSQAFYVQNVTALNDILDLSLGGRSQRVRQWTQDVANGVTDGISRQREAWEIGLTARPLAGVRVYGKLGRTFRFANTDELFGFDPITYTPLFRGDLKPQQGTLREVGAAWSAAATTLRASLYQLELSDEIAYDAAAGINTNLPATRRQGLELEGQWQIARDWLGRLAYTYTEATFREGANQGKDIPSVPQNKLSAELGWNGATLGNWSAVANYIGKQRYSGDDANQLKTLEAYTTLDLKASWDIKPLQFTVRVVNLLDKRYASAVGYSAFNGDYFYYPADPRSLFVSLGYRYK